MQGWGVWHRGYCIDGEVRLRVPKVRIAMTGPTPLPAGTTLTETLPTDTLPNETVSDGAALDERSPDDGELLHEFAASTSVGFYLRTVQDPEFLYVNEGLRRLLDVPVGAPDPTFAQMMERMHPDDLARIHREAMLTGPAKARTVEIRLRATDGTYRWYRASSNPVPAGQGPVVRSVGTLEDIGDLKESQRALERSEWRLRQMADHVSIGFVLVEVESTGPVGFSFANKAYLRIFGFDPDTPLSRLAELITMAVVPEDRPVLDEMLTQLRRGEDANREVRIRRADGQTRWVALRRTPILDDQGRLIRFAGTAEDITERKDIALALRDNEERFLQLANNVSVGFTLFAMTDPPSLVYHNAAFPEIFGLEPEALRQPLGDLMRACVHPADLPKVTRSIERVRAGLTSEDEIRVVRPSDGQLRWLRTRRSPVLDADGVIIRAAGTTEDITAYKTAEAELRFAQAEADRANTAKNEFLSRMSHELRTPLNAVLGFAQLLEMDDLSESQADSVGYIMRGGRHLLALINDVLDIASIEADRLELSMEPVHVGTLLTDAVRLVEGEAHEAGVEIGFDSSGPATDLFVQADQRRLRQVLINLLNNAVKYNRRGGWVDVSAESVGDSQIRLVVADGGVGIRDEDMSRLFVPFDRMGQQASGIEGAGIGLALSKRLVTFMGGHFDVRSVHGSGSVFGVTLPRTENVDDPPSEQDPEILEPALTAPPRTLLYIEDNHSNVRLLQRILQRRPGWSLVHADRGRRGLELVDELDPALVILDLHLPDMDGIDVLRLLRARPGGSTRSLVVASADASPGQVSRLIASGVDAYITKPLDVQEVLSLLDRDTPSSQGLDSPANPAPNT